MKLHPVDPSGDTGGGIDLSQAPGERQAWDRSKAVVYLWGAVELLLVTNPWQVSSKLRVLALRLFGAKIGKNVVFRPRTRVRFPWKLQIGDNCWIGEGVWIHNQAQITIGRNSVVSQESFLTTGSHAHRKDMGLLTSPIRIGNGAWLTARCIVLGGTVVGDDTVALPGSLLRGEIPPNRIWGQRDVSEDLGPRFGDIR